MIAQSRDQTHAHVKGEEMGRKSGSQRRKKKGRRGKERRGESSDLRTPMALIEVIHTDDKGRWVISW